MATKPNMVILGKIHRNEISITNRHKETLDRLKGTGYITSDNGVWTLTDEGIDALSKYESKDSENE